MLRNPELHAIEKDVKKQLDKPRFEHTRGVMYTAAALAMKHGVSVDDAMIAGLLHDYAKNIPNEQKLALCEYYKLPVSDVERQDPKLLHGRLAAYYANTKFGIRNPEILHAIEYHTTGCTNMTLMDMIIYVADYIEPNRQILPGIVEIRQLAFTDIKQATMRILSDSIEYINKKGALLDPNTVEAYEWCLSTVD